MQDFPSVTVEVNVFGVFRIGSGINERTPDLRDLATGNEDFDGQSSGIAVASYIRLDEAATFTAEGDTKNAPRMWMALCLVRLFEQKDLGAIKLERTYAC